MDFFQQNKSLHLHSIYQGESMLEFGCCCRFPLSLKLLLRICTLHTRRDSSCMHQIMTVWSLRDFIPVKPKLPFSLSLSCTARFQVCLLQMHSLKARRRRVACCIFIVMMERVCCCTWLFFCLQASFLAKPKPPSSSNRYERDFPVSIVRCAG